MGEVMTEYFDVVDLATGAVVRFRRDHPVVDGVRRLAAYAVTPDGVTATRDDDGIYHTDDGSQYRDVESK